MMALVDEERTILATSNMADELGDIVGKRCCQVFHSLERSPAECAICRAVNGQSAEEEVHDARSGRWWRIKVLPIASQGSTRFLHLVEDITDTRNLEDGLAQSQEKIRAVFDSVADAMFILELDGTVLEANTAACRILGKGRDYLIGKTLTEFVPQKQCPVGNEPSKLLEQGADMFELHIENGSIGGLFLEVSIRTMQMEGRTVLITSARDITARKAAERKIKLDEERLRALFKQAGVAIAQTDLGGRFLDVNDQFLKMTGYDSSDLIGKYVQEFLDQTIVDEVVTNQTRLAKGEVISMIVERLLLKKNGTYGWVRANTTAVRGAEDRPDYLVVIVEDIDQRKKAEESLRRSEANYRVIVNDQTEFICRFLPDGTTTFANEAYCRYFRARREELVGHVFIEDVPKGDRDLMAERLLSLTPSEPSTTYEHVYAPLYRPIRWMQWTDRAMFGPDGHVVEYQSVGRDISDRLQAQNALMESEERFRNIVERSNDIVWETDKRGIFTFVGGGVKAFLGYEADELVGRSPFEFMPFDQAEEAVSLVTKALETDVPMTTRELEMIRKDGEVVTMEMDIFSIFGRDGHLKGFRGLAKDITERKRAENALRGSEERFRSLVQNSSDIIAVLRTDGVISYISPSSMRLLGYSPMEELAGSNLFDLLHPEDVGRVRSILDRLVQDPRMTASPEFRLRCADGRWAYYEAVVTNLSEEPSVAGLVINARDISERKRSEEVLRRRDEILEAISLVSERLIRGASWEENIQDVMETLGDATQVHRVHIYEMLDKDHGSKQVYMRYEWTSPGTAVVDRASAIHGLDLRKVGLSKWEDTLLIGGIVQANVSDMQHPGRGLLESQGIRSTLIVPILAGYELWGFVSLDDTDSDRAWSCIEIDALRTATGTLGSAILRERASHDLEMEKERLAVTLRSIADGVITTDINGDIVLINNAAEETLGYTQSDVEGQPVHRVFRTVKSGRGSEESPVYRVLKTGQRVEMDSHAVMNKAQSWMIIEDSAAPIRDRSGRVIGAVLVFRDVTARKAIEEELQKAQRLESIGVLAGGIAHDFNNIMTAILGNIALAKTWCRPGERIMGRLMETEKATLRARDLTQQLLTFSKGGAPIRQAASISEILHDTIDFSLSGSNVRPRYDIPEDIWAVNIDPVQISQVLDNLIANAKDAMPEGGTIEIDARNVEIKEGENPSLRSGRFVLLTLRDHGVGIPPENVSKIFEPYFTTKSKGAGLGLAVVYSVITKHEGHIDVYSELGKGTTFRIYLPATPATLSAVADSKQAMTKGKGRVLLMDDEEFILDVTGEVLRCIGYQVEVAKDGEEAIAAYKKAMDEGHRFDAVIMDLTIPGGMGGKEAVLKLLEIDPAVKAIVSSGYSSDATMADHRKYGFSGVIPKPYKIEDLGRIMGEVIGEGQGPCPERPSLP